MKCFITNHECINESSHKMVNRVFVVSPFGYPFDDIYRKCCAFVKDMENQLTLERADQASQLGFVMCQKICKLIQEAEYVLVDVSNDNPNVFYELGLAWGFGKKIILMHNERMPDRESLKEICGDFDNFLTYDEIYEIERRAQKSQLGQARQCAELKALLKSKAKDTTVGLYAKRSPSAYFKQKQVCYCYRSNVSHTDLYRRHIESAVKRVPVQDKEPWRLARLEFGTKKIGDIPEELEFSKICVIDMTHYSDRVDTTAYFTLGLCHALGRDTIPLTNKALCRDNIPFDIRGLWQIYFLGLDQLESDLVGMLETLSKDYLAEQDAYPLRAIWDKVLEHNKNLSVFVCARGCDAKRVARTNVDKWDYDTVATLAQFLGKQYKQTEMNIVPPGKKGEHLTARFADETAGTLQNEPNNVIIIGSPDVSDYAEVALAKIHKVPPYQPRDCCHREGPLHLDCRKCNDDKCLGKSSYLFLKTFDEVGPRKNSSFYRLVQDPRDCRVVWYGQPYSCPDEDRGDAKEGEAFGVLTIVKAAKVELSLSNNHNKWIVILSGFTGVATYGLAHMLTYSHFETSPNSSEDLKNFIQTRDINDGIQILLSLRYTKPLSKGDNYDTREIKGCPILHDAKPLFRSEKLATEAAATFNETPLSAVAPQQTPPAISPAAPPVPGIPPQGSAIRPRPSPGL